MEKLPITSGQWIINEDLDIVNEQGFQIAEVPSTQVDLKWSEKGLRHWAEKDKNDFIDISDEEHQANAKLIADAGTTYNQCGFLPSELKAQKEELLEALYTLYWKSNYEPEERTKISTKAWAVIKKYKSNE